MDKARFPRDKPCGGGLTGRALKHAPCPVDAVVEHVVGRLVVRASYGGKVKTRQRGTLRPVTEAYLKGPVGPCGKAKGKKASASAKKKRRSRHLWGDSHGNFRTVGKSSSASLRGTKWLTKDTCQGTITTVVREQPVAREPVVRDQPVARERDIY